MQEDEELLSQPLQVNSQALDAAGASLAHLNNFMTAHPLLAKIRFGEVSERNLRFFFSYSYMFNLSILALHLIIYIKLLALIRKYDRFRKILLSRVIFLLPRVLSFALLSFREDKQPHNSS